MLGVVSGGFLQGNPVYDYDNHDYIGAYIQDDWRDPPESLRSTSACAGSRSFRCATPRLGEPLRPGALRPGHQEQGRIRRRRPACISRATRATRATARREGKLAQFAPRRRRDLDAGRRRQDQHPRRRGACSTTRRTCSSTRASRTTRRGARRSRSRIPPAAGRIRISAIRAAIRSRRSTPTGQTQPFPAFGVYVNTPIDIEPTALHQWNVSAQRQVRRLDAVGQLSRQPLGAPLARDRAEPRGVRCRRHDRQHQPAPRC